MTRLHIHCELFNGSRDMISISAPVDERTARKPCEVIVTARTTYATAWSTTIVIPHLSPRNPTPDGPQC